MARRIIIGEILNLIKGLGGNPNKFMGTKTNINFLGKGPKENLFQGPIDIEGMVQSGFPIQKVISEAESAGGYVTAGKLNDLQLQRLKDNLISLKKAYFPEQIPNITDLGTGTKDLTQEGLGSLRTKQLFSEHFPGKSTDVTTGVIDPRVQQFNKDLSKRLAAQEGVAAEETILPTGLRGKGDPTKEMTYEFIDPTAEKASYASRFNPKNEVHVEKAKALLEDPQLKGVYTEAEVKNAYDFEGLYQSHFDKGHVDIARFFEMEGHNIPQMRASARDSLLQLMKKEDRAGSGLSSFIDEIDIKYITEGGGGRAGDPINLMTKYFGKNATQNLPKEATKENINKFTDFIMAARDSRGRSINDPFFDRESIDFRTFEGFADELPPFKTGGRVGFRLGGFGGKFTKAQVLIARLKNTIKGMPDDKYVQETLPGFIKEIEANPKLANNEKVWKALGGDLPKDQRLVVHGDDTVDFFTQTKFGPHNIENITRFIEKYPFLSREEAMRILKMEPEDRILEITRLETIRNRTKNASGGLAKILEV